MESYNEINGDLITLALCGNFDVILQGCNCQCVMFAGISVPMKITFGTDKFRMENERFKGDINKLGNIDFEVKSLNYGINEFNLTIINCYTQLYYGMNHPDGHTKPADYEALTLCLRKINYKFKGLRIGLPLICGGLAGGNPELIKNIIKRELKDCYTTLVLFKKL